MSDNDGPTGALLPASAYGLYWSVTRYDDIMAVELDHDNYSSAQELGGMTLADHPKGQERPSFIRMGPAGAYRAPHRRAEQHQETLSQTINLRTS